MQDLKLKCGHTVKAKRWGNTTEGPQILFLHGIQSHSMWFDPLATSLQNLGCESWAYDRRGFGGSDGKSGHIENIEFALDELESVVEIFAAPDRPLHIVGMSWGGVLAAYYAIKNPSFNGSISLIAPGIYSKQQPSLRDSLKIIRSLKTPREVCYKLPYSPSDFSINVEHMQAIESDSLMVRKITASSCMVTRKMQRHVRSNLAKCPVQRITCYLAETDTIIDNRKTEELMKQSDIKVLKIQNSAHSIILDEPEALGQYILKAVR